MMNLFSIFDPSSKFFNMNWISILIPLIIFPFLWVYPHPLNLMIKTMHKTLMKELKLILSKSSMSVLVISLSLILWIFIINFSGLFPFIFTPTSHIVTTMSIALPLWLMSVTFSWLIMSKPALAHLVPLGTPFILMPVMVIIESISIMIRPITLSIRLAANMIAGHLLITLISSQNFLLINSLFFFVHFFLNILELAVSLIQSYVFMILCVLYLAEVK